METHPIVLQPDKRTLYKLNNPSPPAEPKVTLLRVIYRRFLKWLSTATLQSIFKSLRRTGGVAGIGYAFFAPESAYASAVTVLTWNGYKVPMFMMTVLLFLNWKPIYNFTRRFRVRRKAKQGNQHMFMNLVPVNDLATFLQQHRAFRFEDVKKAFALNQNQYQKIGDELEKHSVLYRGEKNARVLRDMPHEDLVRQLRDRFPLVWDVEREVWVERDGAFSRWVLDRESSNRKLQEKTEKRQKKLERIEEKIEEAKEHPIFAQVAAYSS